MKKILALSGGSVKGAWEAGAMKAIFAKGFRPDIIYGISVGNLNGAFVTDRANRTPAFAAASAGNAGSPDRWNAIAGELETFWKASITGRKSIIRNRTFGMVSNIIRILFKNFNGFYKTTPIDTLIDRIITAENLHNSPVEFYSGCTNVHSGDIEYFHSKRDTAAIMQAIRASKAIPFIMEGFNFRNIAGSGDDFFLDGGIRDVIPLRSVFKNHRDVDEIAVVSVHPAKLDRAPAGFNSSGFLELADRLMDIIANETAGNDIKLALAINTILANVAKEKMPPEYKQKNYRKVKIHHLHPVSQADVRIDLKTFGPGDISRLFENGFNNAQSNFKFNASGNYTDEDYMVA